MVSIIIRTKNEERWISLCLRAVFKQNYKDYEVIVVDNNSTDKTVEKALSFGVKLLTIDDFYPGKAINLGIRESTGDVIVCLSGHCIPVNEDWLSNLIVNLEDKKVAGVYGRQEPMTFTSDQNKRDLITVFGLDQRYQKKDPFFHNANSAFRRDVWKELPFDEEITNIEDRVWGQKVISKGYQIVYEPTASVYHHHGIHHDGNEERCKNVIRIIELLEQENNQNKKDEIVNNISELNIIAILPIKGDIQYCGGKPLVEYTVKQALESKYIKKIFVSSDNEDISTIVRKLGAESPFLRPQHLSDEFVGIRGVLQYSLNKIEEIEKGIDIVVVLMANYPFRKPGLLDNFIEKFIRKGTDCLIPVRSEYRSAWLKDDQRIEMISDVLPRKLKEKSIYISLFGLGFITYPNFIREGELFGKNIGLHEVTESSAHIEVRSEESFQFANSIIDQYQMDNQ